MADHHYDEEGNLVCLNYTAERGKECSANVEWRYPLSPSGKSFPRCDRHWDERIKEQQRINRDYPDSPIAPSWFDPADAGEHWDSDY